VYVALGGLGSAIFNEVLQFTLIGGGALLVPILGLIETGGWSGFQARLAKNIASGAIAPGDYTHMWRSMGHFADNPMGIHWTGIVFGLGFAISCGYWTTDFLVVQRVLAANSLRSARMAPVIGSFFKMAVPFIVILPGLLALVVLQNPDGSLMHLVGQDKVDALHPHSYNEVLPLMLVRYCAPGLLGLGITALIAGFMSGMAGNALFSFFISPLLGVVLVGMFWTRATKAGGFWGLLIGTLTSIGLWGWVKADPSALRYVALSPDARDMAENMYRALWSVIVAVVVNVTVSLATSPRPIAELDGLVYGATKLPTEEPVPYYKNEYFWMVIAIIFFLGLNVYFW
jgi:SSS family solute:Na+ symporter